MGKPYDSHEVFCKFNVGVQCEEHLDDSVDCCIHCGWNPDVIEKRTFKAYNNAKSKKYAEMVSSIYCDYKIGEIRKDEAMRLFDSIRKEIFGE